MGKRDPFLPGLILHTAGKSLANSSYTKIKFMFAEAALKGCHHSSSFSSLLKGKQGADSMER